MRWTETCILRKKEVAPDDEGVQPFSQREGQFRRQQSQAPVQGLHEARRKPAGQRGVPARQQVRPDPQAPQKGQHMGQGTEGEYGGGAAFFDGSVVHVRIVPQSARLGNG